MAKTSDPRKEVIRHGLQIEDRGLYNESSHLILALLCRISENLIQLPYLGEKLTSDEEVLSSNAGVRRYFYLNATGDVEPCVYTHMATDNIYNTTLLTDSM